MRVRRTVGTGWRQYADALHSTYKGVTFSRFFGSTRSRTYSPFGRRLRRFFSRIRFFSIAKSRAQSRRLIERLELRHKNVLARRWPPTSSTVGLTVDAISRSIADRVAMN